MNRWTLSYDGFDPAAEGLREALCTLGNGFFATRGAAAECAADEVHYPGTYLAGGYNRLTTELAGRHVENEDLVNLPNWLTLTFRIGEGSWFNPLAVEFLSYRQELDLREGVLLRTTRFRDHEGHISRITHRRLVHMGSPHVAALETKIVGENWSGRLEILSALDGRVVNAGVDRYRSLNGQHLEAVAAEALGEDSVYLEVQTTQSKIRVAEAARTLVWRGAESETGAREVVCEPGYVAHLVGVEVAEGEEVTVEKVVTLFTSRDRAIAECGMEARADLSTLGRFDDLLKTHRLAWDHLWQRFDLDIDPIEANSDGERMAMVLRLHVFHLLQTVSPHTIDADAGVPARGWHGEAYRGHIFWDELFIFPFLNFRLPRITRSLLSYRFRRLGEARRAATEAGYRGAMYPWQSGSSGREESQQYHLNPRSGRWTPDNSRLQRHVSSAIAVNVWLYYQITHDTEFLFFQGAEMMLEIARFWASIASFNPELGRYEIRGVMGPDEYHDGYPGSETPGINNNAYTNLMAVATICHALEALELLPTDRSVHLREAIELEDAEIRHLEDVSRKMHIPFHGDGILSQFEGYDELLEFDWDGYRKKYGDIHRLDRILEAEGDTPNRYKVSKQADVLMLFYVFTSEQLRDLFERLGYPFEPSLIKRNIDYYLPRTSHGSTLSRVVHSWVLARSDRAASWQLFREALESDVADTQGGTTAEGIHLGAMAGTVDLLQRGSAGIAVRENRLWFTPCLPDVLRTLRLEVRYGGHSLEVEITRDLLRISVPPSKEPPVRLGVMERTYELSSGDRLELAFAGCR